MFIRNSGVVAVLLLSAVLFAAASVGQAATLGDAPRVELARESFRVQPHDYRYIHTNLAHWPATLIASAQVSSGAAVRIELLPHRELMRFVRGHGYEFILKLDNRRGGEFRQAVPAKGEYDILFINDENEPSDVRLQMAVEFAREPDVAKYLPPQSRLAVILISLGVFIAIMAGAGFALMHAMRRTHPIH